MAEVGSIFGRIGADASGLKRGLQAAESAVKRTGQSMQRIGRTLTVGLTAPLVAFGVSAVKSWGEQEQALAQVRSALESTGGVAGRTFKQLAAQASALQGKSLFGDEEILQKLTANLLTFTNISTRAFDRTQQAALDLSARLGQDLQTSAIQLGKALNDPVANLGALSRAGIQFSADQKTLIKSLAETGDIAKAQSLILDELEKQYGGAAAAAAAAGTGPIKQLANSFGDLQEEVGGVVADFASDLIPTLKRGVEWFGKLDDGTKRMVVSLGAVAAAAGPVAIGLGSVFRNVGQVARGFGRLGTFLKANPWVLLASAIGAVAVKLWSVRQAAKAAARGLEESLAKTIELRAAIKAGELGDIDFDVEITEATRKLAEIQGKIVELQKPGTFVTGLRGENDVTREAKLIQLRKEAVRLRERLGVLDQGRVVAFGQAAAEAARVAEEERKAAAEAARLKALMDGVGTSTSNAADEAERFNRAIQRVRVAPTDQPEITGPAGTGELVLRVGSGFAAGLAEAEEASRQWRERVTEDASNVSVRFAELGQEIRFELVDGILRTSDAIGQAVGQFATLQKTGVESLKDVGKALRQMVSDLTRAVVRTAILQGLLAAITGGGSVVADSFRGRLGAALSGATGLQVPRVGAATAPALPQIRQAVPAASAAVQPASVRLRVGMGELWAELDRHGRNQGLGPLGQ
jgi:hypothetical protein